ncbi:MAG: DUF1841 family protein [Desulfobacterales bacterium]
MEDEVRQFFRTIGRGRLKRIWQRVKAGDLADLQGEDRRYAAAMADHRDEYFDEFETGDARVFDPKTETDAYLHVSLHVILEGQLAQKEPVEAVQLYNALKRNNTAHHEAIHILAAVFVPFLFDVLKTGCEFDMEGYRRLLKKAKTRKPEKIWALLEREAYSEDAAAGGDPPEGLYRLRIELEDITPRIWRRILVPASASFADLHAAVQGAMGWADAHLHRFEVRDPNTGQKMFFGRPLEQDGWEDNVLPGWQYGIVDFIDPDRPDCRYVYDYGDNWRHRIVLEAVVAAEPEKTYPVCIGGERACPPEDAGGAAGYQDLLRILGDPDHERYEEIRKRVGDYDPERFDPLEVTFSVAGDGRSG